jgi:prepilin-type N-terminal cleavage/methylation domain-containing protein
LLTGGLVQAPTIARTAQATASACTSASLKAAGARARVRRRSSLQGGFTLIELMIVVVLVSILAVIAAPAMRVARDDRMAFDYARQIQQMASRARARAPARGGAHLFIGGPSGVRGRVWLFEALDNTAAPTGPNPSSSCRTAGQWAPVVAYNPNAPAASGLAAIVEGLELDSPGANVDADIRALFFISAPADPTTLASTPAFALCVTPSGTAFGAGGADMATAIVNMQSAPPFTGVLEIRITRNDAGLPVGISRNVTIAGSSAARIHSK